MHLFRVPQCSIQNKMCTSWLGDIFPRDWSFLRGIGSSPHKGSVMWSNNAFCYVGLLNKQCSGRCFDTRWLSSDVTGMWNAIHVLSSFMTSSSGNLFRVSGPLQGEDGWIPLTKANDADLWCFLWSAPEQTVEQTIETPVIWDAIALIMTSL